jgi:hypothetical protein
VPSFQLTFGAARAAGSLAPVRLELRGDWATDQEHNLMFTVGGLTSTLTGLASDPRGRFIYHFANQDNPLETSVLGFAGSWHNTADASGITLLESHHAKEARADGTSGGKGVFQLRKAAAINRSSNQLPYS